MIKLTRLRHGDCFFVNPDLIERVDTHVDTVVRLTSGTEFLVSQTGAEIVARIVEFRARVIALATLLQDTSYIQSFHHDSIHVDVQSEPHSGSDQQVPIALLDPPPTDTPSVGAVESAPHLLLQAEDEQGEAAQPDPDAISKDAMVQGGPS